MNSRLVIRRSGRSESRRYVFVARLISSIYFREKKREKERDELWKKLAELELNHNKNVPAQNNSPPSKK